ncbi:MAG: sigma-54 interaction domain-containing protein [Anaerovoracaceae bacterium]|jgi:PAS domain S-box-containing protein
MQGKKFRRRRLKDQYYLRSNRELDTILDALHDDILIADSKGKIIKVSRSFEKVYGIAEEDIIGRTVYDVEKEGIFRPSVIAKVLEKGEKITLRQKNNLGRELVVTATPIRNRQGEITKVVSFTRDLTDFLALQEQYEELESKIEGYTAEIEELRRNTITIDGIVGKSHGIRQVIETINRTAKFDVNVLLLGPSGVGKTMFSKIIHQRSNRSKGPFIELNCAAIPDNLLESELFGYEKGSFTGAASQGKIGLVELANGGTLFLDEISEIPLSLQAKILKFVQDKTITKVGGTKEIHVDFRLIAASNRNLERLVEENKFRKDLFYRLNVITISIPSLKERKEDIIPLTFYFLDKFNEKYGLNKKLHPHTIDRLLSYEWSGNVRELENTMERIILISEGDVIHKDVLPKSLSLYHSGLDTSRKSVTVSNLKEALEEFEGEIIREAYSTYGTTVDVAKALEISQPTAARKIKKYIGQDISV